MLKIYIKDFKEQHFLNARMDLLDTWNDVTVLSVSLGKTLELLMFHHNIVKFSEKLNKHNLLKIFLQVMYPKDSA